MAPSGLFARDLACTPVNTKSRTINDSSDSSDSEDLQTRDDIAPLTEHVVIGNDSWIGPASFEHDDKLTFGLAQFFDTVEWDVLASMASKYHNGEPCEYSGSYSIGQFNMVRRLVFKDGTSWVVRVRLPPSATPVDLEEYDSVRALEVEIASMMFFKKHTSIPVSEIIAYDLGSENEANISYVLMEYIHGTTAAKLSEDRHCGSFTYGTPEQDQRFRKQMAEIQAELSSHRFPLIGSLYYSKEKDAFHIGPDLDTGKGPWTSSTNYYSDLADSLLKRMTPYACLFKNNSYGLPFLVNYLMTIYAEERAGPFRLVNKDFGAHNILVDEQFNIVGIIDFDAVMAAPIEVVSRYPVATGLQEEIPGRIATKRIVLERIKEAEPQLNYYKELLIQCESNLGDSSSPVGRRLRSLPAILVLAFEACESFTVSWMSEWVTAAHKILKIVSENQDPKESLRLLNLKET